MPGAVTLVGFSRGSGHQQVSLTMECRRSKPTSKPKCVNRQLVAAIADGKAAPRQTDILLRQCSQRNRHGPSTLLASSLGVHMQAQPQKQVVRVHRIDGSIVLYHSPARRLFKAERSLLRKEPWWSMAFAAPLFLRTLLRLVFMCPHLHKGPPITLRESFPSNLPRCQSVYGRGTYITCLDCGQKFAFNRKTKRLVDFWGVHDTEALAGVRRRVDGFFSLLRDLVTRVGRLSMRIPMSEFVRPVDRLGVLTKGQ